MNIRRIYSEIHYQDKRPRQQSEEETTTILPDLNRLSEKNRRIGCQYNLKIVKIFKLLKLNVVQKLNPKTNLLQRIAYMKCLENVEVYT